MELIYVAVPIINFLFAHIVINDINILMFSFRFY